MPRKNLLSLHEAIVIALINQPTRTASFDKIARFIEERNLYPEREGNIPLATQVMLRATKSNNAYAHLFEQADETTIRLRNHNTNGDIKRLNDEIEELKEMVMRVKRSNVLNNILLDFHQRNFAAAGADLIINPNPVKIHGTEKGKGYDVMVGLQDILLIESLGRIKKLYLRKYHIPFEGGPKRNTIETNESFDELLERIQGNGHHIMRVSESYAVNIYQYELLKKNQLNLIGKAPDGFDPALTTIKTDKYFDKHLYHERLMEIDRIQKHHMDISVNVKKIEEINRYKNL